MSNSYSGFLYNISPYCNHEQNKQPAAERLFLPRVIHFLTFSFLASLWAEMLTGYKPSLCPDILPLP